MKTFTGIDIGGTNITVGYVTEFGEILETNEYSTQRYKLAQEMVDDIGNDIRAKKDELNISGIGIGAPNGNYYSGSIEFAPNLPWRGRIPLANMFKQATGLKCKLANDANAAAMGEMIFGGARGMKNFIMLTIGTGVGSGIVVDGKIVLGHDGFAGEMGHVIMVPDGRQCGCGRKGCLEAYCSSNGIRQTYFELKGIEPTDDIDTLQIGEMAKSGDEVANNAFKRTGKMLGLALANFVTITSPEAIFLFGGPIQSGDVITNPIKKYFSKNLLTIYEDRIKLLHSQLPLNHAALLGAVSLVAGSS